MDITEFINICYHKQKPISNIIVFEINDNQYIMYIDYTDKKYDRAVYLLYNLTNKCYEERMICYHDNNFKNIHYLTDNEIDNIEDILKPILNHSKYRIDMELINPNTFEKVICLGYKLNQDSII